MRDDYERALKYFNNEAHSDKNGYYQKIKKGSLSRCIRDILVLWALFYIVGLVIDAMLPYNTGNAGLQLMLILAFIGTVYTIVRELSGGIVVKRYYSEFELDALLNKYNQIKKTDK